MAKLKHEKFKSGLGSGIFGLYRLENSQGREVVFGISGTDMSTLVAGYDDIDFDEKSDKILLEISKESSPYFIWVGHDFFPCEKEEIKWK